MQNNNHLIQRAILRATELHAGQTRKGSPGVPYIAHPVEVGLIVSYYSSEPIFTATALLHDTVEDCEYTLAQVEEEFGPEIRGLVAALTEDKSIPSWKERKVENARRLKETEHALFIKAADVIANMRSLVAALREDGSVVWNRFNAGKQDKLDYYRLILELAENIIPKPMLEEYVSLMKDIEYSEAFEKKPALGFVAHEGA